MKNELKKLEQVRKLLQERNSEGQFVYLDIKLAMVIKRKNEKPKALLNATPAYGWKERKDYKHESRGQLRKAMGVALRVLDILDERGLSQQELAMKMKLIRQYISKVH